MYGNTSSVLVIISLSLSLITVFATVLCPFDQRPCGNKCYSHFLEQECLRGIICKKGEKLCGNRCFSSYHGQQCLDGVVCGKGEKLCGGMRCFSHYHGQQCLSGIVCEKGEIICGNQCYSPLLGQQCLSAVVCGRGQLLCGDHCYRCLGGAFYFLKLVQDTRNKAKYVTFQLHFKKPKTEEPKSRKNSQKRSLAKLRMMK